MFRLSVRPSVNNYFELVFLAAAGYPDPPHFGPPLKIRRKNTAAENAAEILESLSAAEKIRLNSAQYRPIPEMYETKLICFNLILDNLNFSQNYFQSENVENAAKI